MVKFHTFRELSAAETRRSRRCVFLTICVICVCYSVSLFLVFCDLMIMTRQQSALL